MKTTMTISAENFKRAVKAAVSCSGAYNGLSDVYIDIGADGCFMATDLAQFVRVGFNPIKYEGDTTIGVKVDESMLTKISDIKGNDITIMYDSDYEHELKVTNGKKMLTLHCAVVDNSAGSNEFNRESYSIPFEMDRDNVLEVESEEILRAVKTASVFTSKVDSRPILKGYHFNGHDNMIEAIDGYRAVRKLWKTGIMANDYFETVNEQLDNIKNIFTKGDGYISVYGAEKKEVKTEFGRYKYTMLRSEVNGLVIEYAVRNLDGEFHPVAKAYPITFTTCATVKAGAIAEMCKEYKKYISAKDPVPVVFHQEGDVVYTHLKTASLAICEPTDIKVLCGNIPTIGFKNGFMLDVMNVFDKNEQVTIGCNNDIQPMVVDNEEYFVIILPVRLKPERINEVKREIETLRKVGA